MPDTAMPGPNPFFRLPSTRLGIASAWLFVAGIALLLVGPTLGGAFSASIGQVNVGPAIGGLIFLSAIVTGAIALIRAHERSWAVWLAVALPAIVIGAEIISMIVPGE